MGDRRRDAQRGLMEIGSSGRTPRGRRWGLRPLDIVLVVVVVWLLACGVTLRKARSDAGKGLEAVRSAQKLLTPADLVRGTALPPLREARTAFSGAGRSLDSPVVAPLKALPILGRQVRSAGALTRAAARVTEVGGLAVRDARAALARPRATGAQRVDLLRRLGASASRAERALARVELGPGRALVGPLASRRAELAEQLAEVHGAMAKASRVASGLADLLAGPRRYLLLGANNAEMRAGSGMFLSVGELSFAGGDMALGELRPAGEMHLDAGSAPAIDDADLKARWGWLAPNQEWRNLATSPRFPASSELASEMWVARGGAPVDGVLALDPVALKALLSSTGPMGVPGRTVSTDNVLGLLLHDQYVGVDTLESSAQAGRRELLGLIVGATLGALQTGNADVGRLATGLGRAAGERHLLAWARDREEQRMWEAAGVAGDLEARSMLVSVLNRGANKLDPFLDVHARLTVRRGRTRTGAEGELRVTLRNRTPEGESGYVAGLDRPGGLSPGDYEGLLSVNLPGFVDGVKVDGEPKLAAAGRDGPTTVVAWPVRVHRGTAVTQVIRFRLPGGRGALVVEPSARVPPVRWTARGRSWDSGRRQEVVW